MSALKYQKESYWQINAGSLTEDTTFKSAQEERGGFKFIRPKLAIK